MDKRASPQSQCEADQVGLSRSRSSHTSHPGFTGYEPRVRLSVVLCTYNGERYLRQQLDSICGQTRRPDELVIRDDASTDASVEILKSYRTDIPVRITVNERNLGSTLNFERAIADAEGDLIALSDQDDIWKHEKLDIEEYALESGADLVFADADLIDEDGIPSGRSLWQALRFTPREQREFTQDSLALLMRKNVVTGATIMFRASLRDLILPMPATWVHDRWIAMVTAFAARIKMAPRVLVNYRIHSGQQVGLRLPTRSDTRYDRVPEIYEEQLFIWKPLLDRVRAVARPRDLRLLEERIRHLTTRAKLPVSRTARLGPVLGELLAGRYHRHATGFRSALKDALVK